MQTLGIEQLSLTLYRQAGSIPKLSHDLIRRIQDHGFVDPIVVRPSNTPGMFDILSNPEAVLAAGRLQIPDIPVVIREDIDDDQANDIVCDQVSGKVGNPIDEATWFQERLSEAGEEGNKASKASLARLMGTSRTHVSRSLSLLTLPKDVQEHLRAGALSAGHGHILAKLTQPATQKDFAYRTVRDGLAVRQLSKMVEQTKHRTQPAVEPTTNLKDPNTIQLEQEISELIGMPFCIDEPSGKVIIDYCGNNDVLENLLSRLRTPSIHDHS